MTLRHLAPLTLAVLALGCNEKASSTSNATVAQLSVGDAHCPAGGVSVTTNGTTAYACTGAPGLQGLKGDPGSPGIQGLQGIPGGGYYVDRADVYCDTVRASTLPGTDTNVTVWCRANNDLPLHGACYQGDRTDVTLTLAQTYAWASLPVGRTQPAGYRCQWGTATGAVTLATIPSATAEICCVARP